jgi:hypothetical protein
MSLKGLRAGSEDVCLSCAVIIEATSVCMAPSEHTEWTLVWIKDSEADPAKIILYPSGSPDNSARRVLCEIFIVLGRDMEDSHSS